MIGVTNPPLLILVTHIRGRKNALILSGKNMSTVRIIEKSPGKGQT